VTRITDPTPPSVDISNPNVTDGGRIKVGAPSADRIQGSDGSDDISLLQGDDLVAAGNGNDQVL
jgi:hypothetical protein